ncbi:hypothetical protein ACOSQ4_020472 [Xanthoceras sorbifolium]
MNETNELISEEKIKKETGRANEPVSAKICTTPSLSLFSNNRRPTNPKQQVRYRTKMNRSVGGRTKPNRPAACHLGEVMCGKGERGRRRRGKWNGEMDGNKMAARG